MTTMHQPPNHSDMSVLNDFVATIRTAVGDKVTVPGFDPSNGNESSKYLLLLEAPGPQATKRTGVVSFDNNDQTAKNLKNQLTEAGIQRSEIVIWNIVPWYIGNSDKSKIRAAKSSDINSALPYLDQLINLLPNLECIVLVGTAARKAHVHLSFSTNVPILSCHHTSARARNSNTAAYDENVRVFKAMKNRPSSVNIANHSVDRDRPQAALVGSLRGSAAAAAPHAKR